MNEISRPVSLLILGMTYPSYSRKYKEIVCTGALDEATNEMVRIFPMPARYLDDLQSAPSAWQWFTADVVEGDTDGRPESRRIQQASFKPMDRPKADQATRRRMLENSPHMVRSVEALLERNKKHKTSLGIVRPKEITGVKTETATLADAAEWDELEDELSRQLQLAGPRKKLDFPTHRFKVLWRCDDPACTRGHEMRLEEWGVHLLDRKYKLANDPDRIKKVEDAIWKRLDMTKNDIYFFLGSFRGIMWNFGLMGVASLPREVEEAQLSLL